jgi:hypothetical protein
MSDGRQPLRKRVPTVKRAHSIGSTSPTSDHVVTPPEFSRFHPIHKKSDISFDPVAFLARAGLGRKVITLQADELGYAQGDPANRSSTSRGAAWE